MRTLRLLMSLSVLGLLAACTGGDDQTLVADAPPPPVDPGAPPPVVVSSLEALTSNPQIPSDGGVPVTITALLKDENNNFIEGELVTFSSDSGGLRVLQAETDENGRATAELSAAGDPTNRVITVTASSGGLTSTVTVAVTGTQLTISGPTSLVQGAEATYTLVLADAAGSGIAGETVTLTSSLGNTLEATTLTTDFSGQAQVDYTAVNGGTDNFQATALGESAAATIVVSSDTFTFTAPAADQEIDLGANETVTVRWVRDNNPVVGSTVTFSTTRGSVSPTSVVTDASGNATTSITASNAGRATITATSPGGPTASRIVEFVAVTPATVEVQADPFTVSPNSQSTITAVLRDPAGNLVKNQSITFSLDDVTGGSLSVSSAVTDSQGRAQTFYTSSSTTSAQEGVTVTATVDANTSITDSVNLTVAGRQVFFTFGTGNSITETNEAQYSKLFVVQVTDADGRAVSGVNVSMSVVSVRYVKGFWWQNAAIDAWSRFSRVTCDDEDDNRNGFLDGGEDFNSNGSIEAGNVVTVVPGAFESDAAGEGLIELRYPQEYGGWVEVEMEARSTVQGTEFSERAFFILELLADDISDLDQSPPGRSVAADNFDETNIPTGILNAIGGPGRTVYELISSPLGYNQDCTAWEFQ